MKKSSKDIMKDLKRRKARRSQLKKRKLIIGCSSFFVLIGIFSTISFAQSPEQKIDTKFTKVPVTVTKDRLPWDIQRELTPNEDVNEMLYYVKELNNTNLNNIKDGETILFLKSN